MAHWLDNLALQVAADETPRRTALRRVGAGFAGAIGLLLLGASRASAWSDSGGHEEDDEEEKQREKETCDNGLKRCGAICAVISIDPDNCGDCGTTCAPGQVCRGGKCKTECPPASCNMMQCPPNQVACGSSCCMPGQTCMNGVCQMSCPMGFTACNGMCKDLSADPNNCGACGTVCNTMAGQTCVMGHCTCPTGTTACGGMCVNTQTDVHNCGACNNMCNLAHATSACAMGSCVIVSCNPGFGNCDAMTANGCETPLNTNQNCGGCGITCGACQTCSNGMCIPVANGTTCGAGGQVCSNGTCGCPMGGTLCGGTCVMTGGDPNNCGGCGIKCTGLTACCTAGACVACGG